MTIPRDLNINTSDVLKGYHDGVKKSTIGIASATDINDITVLTTWFKRGGKAINIDGSPATNWDKGLSAAENKNYTPDQAKKFLEGFSQKIKTVIKKESIEGGKK